MNERKAEKSEDIHGRMSLYLFFLMFSFRAPASEVKPSSFLYPKDRERTICHKTTTTTHRLVCVQV